MSSLRVIGVTWGGFGRARRGRKSLYCGRGSGEESPTDVREVCEYIPLLPP